MSETDEYWKLINLSIEERLRIAERAYRSRYGDVKFADGLLHAIELVQENGWEHIPPAWVKKYGDK